MTQVERLKEYLKEKKSIDPLKAWTELGIYRLSDAVYRLRKEGLNISTDRKKVYNKFGEACVVANYKMN